MLVLIVISGDTRPSPALEHAAAGVDTLMHEVHLESTTTRPNPNSAADWGRYRREFHTSDVELGKLAAAAKPKRLVLYHFGGHGVVDAEVIANIRAQGYAGRVIVAKDLDRF